LILLPAFVRAEDFEGEIRSLDVKGSSITLFSKSGTKTYRVRLGAEIIINGDPGKLEDLNTGMKAKATTGEPGVATKIVAYGASNRAPLTPEQVEAVEALTKKLGNTRWKYHQGLEFTLQPDGTVTSSWHNNKGTWKVISGYTLELKVSKFPGPTSMALVTPDLSSIHWIEGHDVANRVGGIPSHSQTPFGNAP
jgi:hypothetical protein